MMLGNLRKLLKSSWIKKNNIFDIVVYGSYARGKVDARDIDIAIIFGNKTNTETKLNIGQEFRKIIDDKKHKFDIKAVDFNDFLDSGFLARESIFSEGYSIIRKDYLANRFGFEAFAIIEYSLKKLKPGAQKMFYYALHGRDGVGILQKFGGRTVSKGVIQAPTKFYENIKEIFEQHNVSYKTTFVLKYRIL